MINITNSQLNNDTINALNNLMELDIRSGIAFKLMRIIKDISSLYEDKQLMEKKIFDKCVERDSFNNPAKVFDENGKEIEGAVRIKDMKLFQEEMDSLLNYNNVLTHSKINFEHLGIDSSNTTLKIKDIMKIDFLFE